MTELWIEPIGFSKYLVSNHGQLWSKSKEKYMKLFPNKDGYLYTILTHDDGRRLNMMIHRLVIFTFKGNPPNPDDQVRHYPDSDITNNHKDNLHWGSNLQNQIDYFNDKGHRNQYGKCLTESQIIEIKKRIIDGVFYSDIVEEFGLCNNELVSAIKSGRKYSYWGPDISDIKIDRRKFNADQIREIRSSPLNNCQMAFKMGTTDACISKIRKFQIYGDIE